MPTKLRDRKQIPALRHYHQPSSSSSSPPPIPGPLGLFSQIIKHMILIVLVILILVIFIIRLPVTESSSTVSVSTLPVPVASLFLDLGVIFGFGYLDWVLLASNPKSLCEKAVA